MLLLNGTQSQKLASPSAMAPGAISASPTVSPRSSYADEAPLWRIFVLPIAAFVALMTIAIVAAILDPDAFFEAKWILITGLVAALVSAGAIFQSLLYRRIERNRTREHLDAIESLTQVAGALIAVPGSGNSVLKQLCDSIQQLLRMPMCLMLQLEEDNQSLRIIHHSGVGEPPRQVLSINELTGVRQGLEKNQVVFTSDLTRDPGPFNAPLIKAFGVRALLILPMVENGRAVGAISFADHVPRHLSDLDMRMARLWGTQAAVILVQNRLYDQLHQQVTANQTLLSELNHRVKNNLAGIVGLLAADQPELSPQTRKWLDRVATRIQTMARAHELFASGSGSVQIRDLIERVMTSLQALKPPGILIQTDVSTLDAQLPSDRTVTLAMVLHELCFNSITHGLGPSGTITVRGRSTEPGQIVIEVIDEPDAANGKPPNGDGVFEEQTSSGLGLKIVDGLVGRELRGTLSLTRTPQGGTIATVKFPLDIRPSGTSEEATHDRAAN